MTLTLADLRTDLTDDGGASRASGPQSDRPKRRVFSPDYKLAMVEAYDAATESGAKGALLRREGLYHSHIIEWRKARDAGALNALATSHQKLIQNRDFHLQNHWCGDHRR